MNTFLLTISGMIIYLIGALIVVLPGVAYFEKCHKPGRILRALEELEDGWIGEDHIGFTELKQSINAIVEDEDRLSGDIDELRKSSTPLVGGMKSELVGREKETEEKVVIENPQFHEIRYRLNRKIRHGKTKIRLVGITLILIGTAIQLVTEFNLLSA